MGISPLVLTSGFPLTSVNCRLTVFSGTTLAETPPVTTAHLRAVLLVQRHGTGGCCSAGPCSSWKPGHAVCARGPHASQDAAHLGSSLCSPGLGHTCLGPGKYPWRGERGLPVAPGPGDCMARDWAEAKIKPCRTPGIGLPTFYFTKSFCF